MLFTGIGKFPWNNVSRCKFGLIYKYTSDRILVNSFNRYEGGNQLRRVLSD
jgi:hypothetical protein